MRIRINGRRFPWVFHTWSHIGRNYLISLGFDPLRHAFGVRLYWGHRVLLGEKVLEGETLFADEFEWLVGVSWW